MLFSSKVAVSSTLFVLVGGQAQQEGSCSVGVEAIPMAKESAALVFTCPKGYFIVKETISKNAMEEQEQRVDCEKCTPDTRPWHLVGLPNKICPYNMKEKVSSFPVFSEAEEDGCSGTKEYDDTNYTCESCTGTATERANNSTDDNDDIDNDISNETTDNETDTDVSVARVAYALPEGCTYVSQCLDTAWEGDDVQISCGGCMPGYYYEKVEYDFETNEVPDANKDTFVDSDSDGVDDALTGTLPDDMLPPSSKPKLSMKPILTNQFGQEAKIDDPDDFTGTLPDELLPVYVEDEKEKEEEAAENNSDRDRKKRTGSRSPPIPTLISAKTTNPDTTPDTKNTKNTIKQQKTIFKTGMCVKCYYDKTNCDTEKNIYSGCRGHNPLSKMMPFFYDTSSCRPKPEPRTDTKTESNTKPNTEPKPKGLYE